MFIPIVIIVIVVLLLFLFLQYNSLITAHNKVKQSKSGIDVYLNQRFDLIPNLVECVKGYSQHEKDVIEKITAMRSSYINNKKSDLKQAKDLNNTLNNLILVAENYPDLKASDQYLKLQHTLTKLESQLQAARRIYNNDVTKYNTKLNVVPSNIVAKIFKFKEEELFESENIDKININM